MTLTDEWEAFRGKLRKPLVPGSSEYQLLYSTFLAGALSQMHLIVVSQRPMGKLHDELFELTQNLKKKNAS